MLCEHNEEIVIRSQAIRYRGLITRTRWLWSCRAILI